MVASLQWFEVVLPHHALLPMPCAKMLRSSAAHARACLLPMPKLLHPPRDPTRAQEVEKEAVTLVPRRPQACRAWVHLRYWWCKGSGRGHPRASTSPSLLGMVMLCRLKILAEEGGKGIWCGDGWAHLRCSRDIGASLEIL